ncbi:AbrB/MazE/SpoVT family DNA-binding domain-containing protein [Nodosilinea sp. PGN35]|uniref:AbrB/MazE/SpoVT family DNA-binding domain-containing protein n=1 Tax=Nodosilinea sp. PGN35 TaxID=3020489 RepID=UPI0023B211E4|nr:AbrB/MazE/SpoVT family DNA-binding domain-containing protein [Nodosilinea sp. TSF1-S3]MDF0367476.1 AbrB/MazE/SpoVT family DNA-binding domain-containing protein [Nodosilinea sp. TSF1-S3]
MDIQLKKWGNSLSLQIPDRLAESFGWDENSTVEILAVDRALVIRKKAVAMTLNELLASIPADFRYPDDVHDFADGLAQGQELL